MKTSAFYIVVIVTLSVLVVYLLYFSIGQGVAVDNMGQAIASHEEREACLLRIADAFVASKEKEEFLEWVDENLSDLDVFEQESLVIVNQVGFEITGDEVSLEKWH